MKWIEGARARPPEDCGGIYGYADFLEALRDPEQFDLKEINAGLRRLR